MVVDDPVRHHQFALSSQAGRLLHRFANWTDFPETQEGGNSAIAQQLLEAHVLVAEGSPEHLSEENLGAWAEWGTAATYYHLATRNRRDEKFATGAEDTEWLIENLAARPQPPEIKEYPQSAQIALPAGSTPLLISLEHALRTRRSTRRLQPGAPVRGDQLATLLRWVAGPVHQVQRPDFRPFLLKASPSPGALHTIEVYPVVRNVTGVEVGIYHYHCVRHALELVVPGAVDDDLLLDWCGGQTHMRHAGVVLLYTARLDRMAWKYQTGSAYRSVLMELGHLSQTSYLVGTALGLGMCFTAATRDEAIEEALGLDWTQETLLGVSAVGIPEPGEAARQKMMLAGEEADFSFAGDAWDGRGP